MEKVPGSTVSSYKRPFQFTNHEHEMRFFLYLKGEIAGI